LAASSQRKSGEQDGKQETFRSAGFKPVAGPGWALSD
jgi:hypothetical protein